MPKIHEWTCEHCGEEASGSDRKSLDEVIARHQAKRHATEPTGDDE